MKPKIIVLCGSSKYCDIMAVVAWILEKDEGVITMGLHLLPEWYVTSKKVPGHLAEHEGVADHMDNLHKHKIDLSDGIFVVNWENYVGKSTTSEIEYAKARGIPIRYLLYGEPSILLKVVNKMKNYNKKRR